MYRLGIIEESLESKEVLELIKPCFISQYIENVPEDECPVWHTNEYHVGEDKIYGLMDILKDALKETWYIHAFNEEKLYVVLDKEIPIYSPFLLKIILKTDRHLVSYG